MLNNFCDFGEEVSDASAYLKSDKSETGIGDRQKDEDLCSHIIQINQDTKLPCCYSVNALQSYQCYLKLLKKQVVIPDYEILYTSDLVARLLRQRYLSLASAVLGFNNINYFNLYDTFVISRSNLLLAQELDVAIIFSSKRTPNSYLLLQVIEGGFFLQTLLACTLVGVIEKSLSLQIKTAYINWLNYLLVNIKA